MASIIEMINSGWFVGMISVLLFILGVVVGRSSRGPVWSLAEMRHVVEMLVQEAEQTMAQEAGEDRLGWVLARADELGITKYVPAALLSAMIESAVYWVNRMRDGQAVERGLWRR